MLSIPLFLFSPAPTVGQIMQQPTMLPVISGTGVIVLNREVRILHHTIKLEGTLVSVVNLLVLKYFCDDHLGFGPNSIAARRYVNQAFFQKCIAYRNWIRWPKQVG